MLSPMVTVCVRLAAGRAIVDELGVDLHFSRYQDHTTGSGIGGSAVDGEGAGAVHAAGAGDVGEDVDGGFDDQDVACVGGGVEAL